MNIQILQSYFLKRHRLSKNIFDHVWNTWQMSYVRFCTADKKDFESIEEFYYTIITSEKNPSYTYLGQQEWADSANWIEWCKGLKIEITKESVCQIEFEDAIKEIKEEEESDPSLNAANKIGVNRIQIPKKMIRCWSINETKENKHAAGSTLSFIINSEVGFFYFEKHWES